MDGNKLTTERPEFGQKPAKAPKPPKERLLTHREAVARICGNVAGIRDVLATAAHNLKDVRTRCALATSIGAEILSDDQKKLLDEIGDEIAKLLPTVEDCRRDIEPLIAGGIGVEAKQEESIW